MQKVGLAAASARCVRRGAIRHQQQRPHVLPPPPPPQRMRTKRKKDLVNTITRQHRAQFQPRKGKKEEEEEEGENSYTVAVQWYYYPIPIRNKWRHEKRELVPCFFFFFPLLRLHKEVCGSAAAFNFFLFMASLSDFMSYLAI